MSDVHTTPEPDDAEFNDFVQLLKPRVMSLVVFTALVGLLVAPKGLTFIEGFASVLFIALVAGASGVTGEIDETDWASFGAQLRASLAGRLFVAVRASPKHIVPCP